MQLYASYFWRLEKSAINDMRAVTADAGPELQHDENV